jgi:hypothetical protein
MTGPVCFEKHTGGIITGGVILVVVTKVRGSVALTVAYAVRACA